MINEAHPHRSQSSALSSSTCWYSCNGGPVVDTRDLLLRKLAKLDLGGDYDQSADRFVHSNTFQTVTATELQSPWIGKAFISPSNTRSCMAGDFPGKLPLTRLEKKQMS